MIRSTALLFGFLLALGLPLAASAGPISPTNNDTDGDTVEDEFDNCLDDSNPGQQDDDQRGHRLASSTCSHACVTAVSPSIHVRLV